MHWRTIWRLHLLRWLSMPKLSLNIHGRWNICTVRNGKWRFIPLATFAYCISHGSFSCMVASTQLLRIHETKIALSRPNASLNMTNLQLLRSALLDHRRSHLAIPTLILSFEKFSEYLNQNSMTPQPATCQNPLNNSGGWIFLRANRTARRLTFCDFGLV
jgi:hypothetical protein